MNIHGIDNQNKTYRNTDEMMTAFYNQNVFQADYNGVKRRLIDTETCFST